MGFADLLRQLRAEARLTQEELAEAAGLSPRSVSDLERGINRTARKDTAVLLASALGLAEPVHAVFVAAARGRAPAAGRGHELLPHRPGQAKRTRQQLGGVLTGRAVDAPLQVTDRPRTHFRRFGQLLLSQPRLDPQLPQQPAETRRRRL